MRSGQHGHRHLTASERSQNRTPSGIGESLECRVERVSILNHRVYHYT